MMQASKPSGRRKGSGIPASGIPARGYSWQSAKKGSALALKHGAMSPRLRDPLAKQLVGQLMAEANEPGSKVSYLAEPSYRAAVGRWADAEAVVQLLQNYIVEQGALKEDGDTRPALDALRNWSTLAANLRARLGLDPLSRARLGKDITGSALDLARLWAAESAQEGRKALEANPQSDEADDGQGGAED
jgi:hypothetical protein